MSGEVATGEAGGGTAADRSGARVLVVGAVNVDFVVTASSLPGPGETVVGAGCERHGGGKGANAAVAAARAGGRVALVGAVGADETGNGALAQLREAGVEVGGVAVLGGVPTGVALIVVDRRGENQIAVGAGANAALTADWVARSVAERLPGAACVLVSTEIPGAAVLAAVRAAAVAGVRCVLNPAPPIDAVLDALEHAPLLTPNATELASLASRLGLDGAGWERRGTLELAALRASALSLRSGAPVVVTLGGEGALIASAGAEALHVPARAADVLDTTGAGDTFNGALALRLAAGAELEDAVRFATAAAGLSVSGEGARGGMPDAQSILAALSPA